MRKPRLKLIDPDQAPPATRLDRTPVALGALLLAAAALVTGLGAAAAREELDARGLAAKAIDHVLANGVDAEARSTLAEIRRHLGASPLDSKTRVAYASLLLALSSRLDDTSAAAFHAARAAALAPVTLSVVQTAAGVLARCGESDAALALVRSAFDYDPEAAARTLAALEPFLIGANVESGLPAAPSAWLAWTMQLRRDGRGEEADLRLATARERWPTDLALLGQAAAAAVARDDWTALEAMLPASLSVERTEEAAPVLLYRARLAARMGDATSARKDVDMALELDPRTYAPRVLAGEVFAELGDLVEARRQWNRALFSLDQGALEARMRVLRLLAQLEERHGEPAAALRLWKSVLALDPRHAEARHRVEALSGSRR